MLGHVVDIARFSLWLGCGWLAACDCHAGFPELFYDDLQEVCAGAPCEWQVETGTLSSVATLHSTERGMRLASGTRIARTVSFPIEGETRPLRAPRIHALAICEGHETELRFVLELEVDGEPQLLEATLGVTGRSSDPLPLRELDLLTPDGAPPGDARAVRLVIEVDGPDSCTIDELRVVGKTSESDC